MRSSEGKAFGELLGQFRTEAKLSQKKLANLIGKSRGAIVNWENGTHLPKERALVLELAKHLHLDRLKKDQLLAAAFFDPLGTIWTIPFQRNPFFTGREDILNYLQKALNTDKTVALMQPQALKGLGGIGKTHTAIEYAYRHRDEYQAILWAPATTASDLQTNLVSIAETLNLPEKNEREQELIVTAVKRWMMDHSDWLLILDNVEELESVQSLYPWAHSGHVIITTRSQYVGGLAPSISLEKMEPEEGALLLLRRAKLIGPQEGKEHVKGTDYEKATELSEVFGGLPLAIDQAAAYIEETRCSLASYLQLYQWKRAELLRQRGILAADHPESVTVTFFLAFQKVRHASLAAQELLQFCAFLSPDAIPEEIITNGGSFLGPTLEPIVTDLDTFNGVLKLLLAYSLIHRDTDIKTGTHILSMHRLVQAVLQDTLEEAEQRTWAQRTILAVNAAFPDPEYNPWPQEHFLTQAMFATHWIEQYHFLSEESVHLLSETAFYLQERNRYKEAEPLLQQALRISEQQLGSEHPEVAWRLSELAGLYKKQDKYTVAEQLYQQALHICEQQSDPNYQLIALLLDSLAQIYEEQDKDAEATSLYERALRLREQNLGLEHPDVAFSLLNMARLYEEQDKDAEATSLYERALHLFEQQQGPEHPDVAFYLHNLARFYTRQNKYAEAEPLLQRALHICEQLGPEHPDVASSLIDLANLYNKQGKYAEAELLYQRALCIFEQQLDPGHPNVAFGLSFLAHLYTKQGKYAEAEPLLQRALHIREQQFGPEHLELASELNFLADLLLEQNKHAEAEPLLQRALRISEEQLGPEDPQVAYALQGLATLSFEQGNYAEAEPLLQRALHIREQQFGPEHRQVAPPLRSLANLYSEQGKYREAELLYQRALAIQEQRLGPDHPQTAETLHDLATFQEIQGNHQEALSLYHRAFTIREQVFGPEHPTTEKTHQRLTTLRQSVSPESVAPPWYDNPLEQSEQNP